MEVDRPYEIADASAGLLGNIPPSDRYKRLVCGDYLKRNRGTIS